MKKVLLACTAGMSTSILLKKVEDAAYDSDYKIDIKATSVDEAKIIGENYDLILLGPQVSYEKEALKKILTIPVLVINAETYSIGSGEKIINLIINTIGK